MTRKQLFTIWIALVGGAGINIASNYVPTLIPFWLAIAISALFIFTSTPYGFRLFTAAARASKHFGLIVWSFARTYSILLPTVAVILVGGLIIWRMVASHKASIPPEVQEARTMVVGLQQLHLKDWYAADDKNGMSVKKLSIHGYELMVEEDANLIGSGDLGHIFRTYIKNGHKFAVDRVGQGSSAFVREYFRPDDCIFFRDHFDASGRYLFLEYWSRCDAEPKVIDVNSPVLLPPYPVAGYR